MGVADLMDCLGVLRQARVPPCHPPKHMPARAIFHRIGARGPGGLSDPHVPIEVRVMLRLALELLKACFYVLVLHATPYSTSSTVLHCIGGYHSYQNLQLDRAASKVKVCHLSNKSVCIGSVSGLFHTPKGSGPTCGKIHC